MTGALHHTSEINHSCIWDPHLETDVDMVEAVQHRAARFVSGNYLRDSSMKEMMETIGW